MSTPFLNSSLTLHGAPPGTPDVLYSGNCHCGAVKFRLTLPDLRAGIIMRCNCSICTKKGYQFVYPKRSEVEFISGLEGMKTYRFGGGQRQHRFCGECGTNVMIDFADVEKPEFNVRLALNISTFTGIEELMGELTFVALDGKNILGPAYQVPE